MPEIQPYYSPQSPSYINQTPTMSTYGSYLNRLTNYPYETLESQCNSQNLTNLDIIKLGKTFGIKDSNLSTICTQISEIFKKKISRNITF